MQPKSTRIPEIMCLDFCDGRLLGRFLAEIPATPTNATLERRSNHRRISDPAHNDRAQGPKYQEHGQNLPAHQFVAANLSHQLCSFTEFASNCACNFDSS